MTAVMNERQITEQQQEQLDLQESAPEKYDVQDLDLEFKINKQSSNNRQEVRYRAPTREEVAALLAASNAPVEIITKPHNYDYPTLSREECSRLVREHYEYKERERQTKYQKELEEWDSQKTTVFAEKTNTTKKRGKSTKA